MSLNICEQCLSKKTAITCSSCSKYTCKKCVQFVDEYSFEFIEYLPASLQDKGFCSVCYDEHVDQELSHYQNLMELAKNINVYKKEQSAETRLMRREKKPIKVEDCNDRQSTLMRLAFLAAQQGYETIVDVELNPKKIKQGGRYKKIVWNGSAVPIDSKKQKNKKARA